jgi:hypothetical protein
MTIIIKNVGNKRENWGYLWELQRAGYPEGTVVEDVCFSKKNNACYWRDCVAWLGATCEIIKKQ